MVPGDGSKVKVETECSVKCKPGFVFKPVDTDIPDSLRPDSEFVTCIGEYETFGFASWDFIPGIHADDWLPHKAHGDLDIKMCVPEIYLNKD